MTKIITVGNFKGGVGKSTFVELLAYILATKENRKVLVFDTDPQADVTEKLKRTFGKEDVEPETDLLQSIKKSVDSNFERDISGSIVSLHENLDLVHGSWHLEQFDTYVVEELKDKKARYYLFYTLLQSIKEKYDYIIYDTRPSTGITTTNAICSSDFMIVTTQTEEASANSTRKIYNYIGSMLQYNEGIELIGVLPYLVDSTGAISRLVEAELREQFQEDMYEHVIRSSKRVVAWGKYGITEDKPYDKKTLQMYVDAVDETLQRIKNIEAEKEGVN